MRYRTQPGSDKSSDNPYDGSSLVPMLVAGLGLTLVGMIAALLFV
jgi:hypothetical protein